jgi:sortase A
VSDREPPAPRPPRVRKFDRPPPPHDWRWWVGGIGKTLIATGLLLFGFVAYQLWGTGIETARAQNSLENEFEELLAGTPPATAAPVGSAPPESVPAGSAPVASVPAETAPSATAPSESAPATTAPTAVASLPSIAEGDPIARLELPSIGVDKIVIAGVDKNDLKKGPGHYPETPLPGQLGNSAIAGHRTTFGQPFFDVDKLDNGDEIVVTTLAGRFVYRVTGQEIVSPSDYQVIATTDPTTATLTLTSCHPKYTARERIIVYAELDPTATTGTVDEPTINYGRPLDDDATADPDPTNIVAEPTTTEAGAETTGTSPTEDPTLSANALDDQQIGEISADAFSDGWFSDPGANSQVGLWGLLLAAIGVGSYLLSRQVKRDWVGLLVGVGPFVVTLYFFFQNVNRLLPPNL